MHKIILIFHLFPNRIKNFQKYWERTNKLRETKEEVGKTKLKGAKKKQTERTSTGGEEGRVGGSSGSIMRGFSAIA